jgi:heptosyltransferase II
MKILVISLAGIGDTLLATPLIHELRLNFPEAQMDALVLWPGSRDLLENNPHLSRVHQRHLLKEPRLGSVKYLRQLARERYDLSINTHPQSKIHYRVAAWLAGARRRISHEYECFTPLDQLLVNETLPQDYSRNTVDLNFDILRLLGKRPQLSAHSLELFLEPAEEAWADEFLRNQKLSNANPLVGVHAGSGGTKNLMLKRWPPERYAQLLSRATATWPQVSFLLFGGPDEDAELEELQARVNSPRLIRVKSRTLRQAAALMKRCRVFLSVDTALMHVAAAVKVPTHIVIEAPTLNKTNEPYGNPFVLVPNPAIGGRNLDYYRYDGKGIRGTREELLRCMASITPEAVFERLAAALNEPAGTSAAETSRRRS